jgi:hypothetical protein
VKTGQNLTANVLVPEAPEIVLSGDSITWKPRETDKCYVVYRNGLPIDSATTTAYCPAIESVISEYQIAIVDLHGEHSALSRPLRVGKAEHEIPIEQLLSGKNKYLKLNSKIGESYSFTIDIPADGCYAIDYCYANGNGPINTDNKCAIRSMAVDNRFCGPIVLPQRGTNEWDNWGFTNAVYLNLEKGNHLVRLYFDKLNMNMNGSENSALVKTIRITKLDADRKQ